MNSSDSDSSEDNINLKELQCRIHTASSLNINFDCSISDDSDRDITWKPSKEDLVSSSDESDSFYDRHDRSPKKKLLENKEAKDKTEDVEMIVASLIEDNLIKPIISQTDDVAKMIGSIIEDYIIGPVFGSDNTDHLEQERGRKKRKSKGEREREYKKRKEDKITSKYAVKPGCGNECKKKPKCKDLINEDVQTKINGLYWSSIYSAQKMFLLESVLKSKPKKEITNKKSATFKYTLKNGEGERISVCKTFFLGTLGFKPKNDMIISHLFKETARDQASTSSILHDKRGKASNTIHDTDKVKEHIESYNPTVAHYRRKHAPLRRYLTSELTIAKMHTEYKEKTGSKISYSHFQKIFKSMNISMAILGHEECEICSRYNIHKQSCNCQSVCELDIKEYILHKRRYTEAREIYQKDSNETETFVMTEGGMATYSADLQKVILLPRMDEFKKAIFTKRLVVFNETFAGVSKGSPNFAVLWHEGISARQDEDLASVFHRFLLELRDCENIVLWLDNCSGQNKNWTLFSMLVVLINCQDIKANKISLRFFQPGHTFMSADAAHSRIEREMKRIGKVYDFNDFVACVTKAKCHPILMEHHQFRQWQSGVSVYNLKKLPIRPKLANMVEVCFKRGSESLFFKNDFGDVEQELSFLKKNFNVEIETNFRTQPRGVTSAKKQGILQNLLPLMPLNRRSFWLALEENETVKDLASDYDD